MPNFPRDEDLAAAKEVGCMPVLDGAELADRFYAAGLLGDTVGLRITPKEPFRFGLNEVATDGIKFGVPEDQLPDTVRHLKELGVQHMRPSRLSVRQHAGAGVLSRCGRTALWAWKAGFFGTACGVSQSLRRHWHRLSARGTDP